MIQEVHLDHGHSGVFGVGLEFGIACGYGCSELVYHIVIFLGDVWMFAYITG
jgi:hypothetical protein